MPKTKTKAPTTVRPAYEALNHAAAGFAVILNVPNLPSFVREFAQRNHQEALAAARALTERKAA
jgi:hypothetical protein